jgi:DNA ligase-1
MPPLPREFKPTLCAKDSLDFEALALLRYPVYVSPKIDGIRVTVDGRGKLQTRSGEKLPNMEATEIFGQLAAGLDGELVYGDPTAAGVYNRTQSNAMSFVCEDESQFRFYVFDLVPQCFGLPFLSTYKDRYEFLHLLSNPYPEQLFILPQVLCHTPEEVLDQYYSAVEFGHEGICIRSASGHYKFGRSTNKEQILLRMKQFEDAEAEIIAVSPLLYNNNEATESPLGYTKRSHHQDNKFEQPIVGSLRCRDLKTKIEFGIGVFKGVTVDERARWWTEGRDKLPGRVVKYRKHAYGEKDAPRQAVFLGFREPWDM